MRQEECEYLIRQLSRHWTIEVYQAGRCML